MYLAPLGIFFHGGHPIALAIPPAAEWPTWIGLLLWFAAISALGFMTRWWPDKSWPVYVWLGAFAVSLIVFSALYPVFRWIVIIQIVGAALWYILKSSSGPRDDDE